MTEFKTIYSSNIPIDCYIIKGRLESEGLDCFIYDETLVSVHPFKAVAIGGVKLKVPSDQIEYAEKIMSLIAHDTLSDENGEYNIDTVFKNEIIRQDEILEIKFRIRKDYTLLDRPEEIKTEWLNQDEIKLLIDSEKINQNLSNTKLNFTW